MALKSYDKRTLIGNWFEEQSPSLKGVIADYNSY